MSVANKPAVIGAFDREIIRPQDDVPKPAKKASASPFRLIPFDEIKLATGDIWLVKGLVPRKGVGIFFGPSQTYKSFIILDLLISIAAKRETWGGAKIKRHGAVVYICAEGEGGLPKRVIGIAQKLGVKGEKLPFYAITARPRLGIENGSKQDLIAEIRRTIPEDVPIAAVVVDTLSQCLGGGDENGSGAQIFIATMTDIASTFDCVAIAVHHVGKGDDKRTRGHSSLDGNPDFQWLVESQGSMASRVSLAKMKDGDRNVAFDVRLALEEIGVDDDGKAITTLVVDDISEAIIEGSPKGPVRLNAKHKAFLDLMDRVANDGHKKAIRFEIDGPLIDTVPNEMVRDLWISERAMADEKTAIASAQRDYDRVRMALVDQGRIRIKGKGKEGVIGWC
jgi:hypothetical protein